MNNVLQGAPTNKSSTLDLLRAWYALNLGKGWQVCIGLAQENPVVGLVETFIRNSHDENQTVKTWHKRSTLQL